MRQLLYISSKTSGEPIALDAILSVSRRNNMAVGATGLLYTDGTRFLQVLEGDAEAVTATFERIRRDPRHKAVVVLSDREVTTREFGAWSMAHQQPAEEQAEFDRRLDALLAATSPSVRGTFNGLVAARRAA